MENKDGFLENLGKVLCEAFESAQRQPNQFVISYKKKSNDELIGYHADSFCSITSDILRAKRYSGEDPYPQLTVVWKNICSLLDKETKENMFYAIHERNKKAFGDLTSKDIYIDAVYLADGTEPQTFKATIF